MKVWDRLIERLAEDHIEAAYAAGRREYKARAIHILAVCRDEDLEDSQNPQIKQAERNRCKVSSEAFAQGIMALERVN